jgi:F-type H+-transporting ATPase subunit a
LSRLYVDELSFEEETALVDLFAGEVIFLIIGLLGYWQAFLHIPWAIFHLLVIPLQAYLFMMLTIVYLNQAHQHH